MDKFDGIINLAAKIGGEEELQRVSGQMDELLKAEDTQAVILGGSNSGKTFIINSFLGVEVKEPDMLSQENEKPLRITFEKCDEVEKYECHVVMNREWNDEGVILYEFKPVGVLEPDGTPGEEMNTKDIVFYIVSALAPLTSEDVRIIKALKEVMPVYVLINKLDMVDEASKEKVEKYVQDFCSKAYLPKPISVNHEDTAKLSKTIRDILPDVLIRNMQRDNHVDAVYKMYVNKLINVLRDEIALEKAAEDQTKSEFQTESAKKRLMRSQWETLQADMIEANSRTCREVSEKLRDAEGKMADRLYQSGLKNHFSKEWEEKILPKLVSETMFQYLNNMRKRIEVSLAEDVRDIALAAAEKGLSDSLVMDIPAINVDVTEAISRDCDIAQNRSFSQQDQAKKILGLTGAALGVILIVPIPLSFTVVGGIATVIAGGSSYQKSKEEWDKSEWKKGLEEYARINMENLIKVLKSEIDEYCRGVIGLLVERKKDITVGAPDNCGSERIEELEKALGECEALYELCRNV